MRTLAVAIVPLSILIGMGETRADNFERDRAAPSKEALLEAFPKWYPRAGDDAIDFTRADLDGSPVTLSKLWATRPVVLEFGTCT